MARRPLTLFLILFSTSLQTKFYAEPQRMIASAMRDKRIQLNVKINDQKNSVTNDEKIENKLDIESENKWRENLDEAYLLDVYAVKNIDFNISQGEMIERNSSFSFYRGQQTGREYRVKLNKISGKLEPLLAVIHLKNISLEQKDLIESKGFETYYYYPLAKILTVKSTQKSLFRDSEFIEGLGFSTELESIGSRPKNF